MKSFNQFVVESALPEQTVVFVFGRFNPPTKGHGLLFDTTFKISKKERGDFRIFTGQTQDAKKNPLDYNTKIKVMRKMFPAYGRNIIKDKSIKQIFEVLDMLHNQQYNRLIMVAGSDRVSEFKQLIMKYNGVEARHGFYDFLHVDVISAGERDPDQDDLSGVSASKAREAAMNNNFEAFQMTIPDKFKQVDALFNSVRKGMNL